MHVRTMQQGTLVLILIVFVACFFFSSPASHTAATTDSPTTARLSTTLARVRDLRQSRSSSTHDKTQCARWIVITSIQPLTTAVQKAASLPMWCVVVVADQKSPHTAADYGALKLGDSLVYLDLETQQQLGYSILKHIPYNSYARKNIGYLYAIQHGAHVIYETDDDNQLLHDLSDFLSEEEWLALYATTDSVVNPYAHFGQPSIWPRGYPLTAISKPDNHSLVEGRVHSWIQQSLANGDPDVDAIFRLTRKPIDTPLTLTFDSSAPPVALPANTFCPYNSQNTLHHKPAFWALLLPTSVSFRVSDIWRSYWAQRLLWQVGGNLVFLVPTVYQERNAHNYLQDFMEELQLYAEAEHLISFLLQWKPPPGTDFPHHIIQLSRDMATTGFWKEEDAALTQAWCEDLIRLGYEFPPLREAEHHHHRNEQQQQHILFQPEFRETSMIKHYSITEQAQHATSVESHGQPKEAITLFICILAAPHDVGLRQAVRDTYLSHPKQQVRYRFFTDFVDESTRDVLLEEHARYGDLHISSAGVHCPGGRHCSTSFGLVLEALEWTQQHYDYTYFLRLDLDGYLCLPQLLLDLEQRPTKAYMAGNFACHAYPPERFFRADGAFVLFTADLAAAFLAMQPLLLTDSETTFAINFAAFIFPLNVVLEHRFWNAESENVCSSLVFVHCLKSEKRIQETHELALSRIATTGIAFTPLRNICEEERVAVGKTLVHQRSPFWGEHSMDVRKHWIQSDVNTSNNDNEK